jgi:dihydropteroate synthase
MLEVVAEFGVPVVLMHNHEGNVYSDLLAEVAGSLRAGVERALASGVPRENVIVDPGIGFGKVADQSLEIEGRLRELGRLGQPVLVGPSRKSHLGRILGGLPPRERLEGTAAAVSLCVAGGADVVRVHDVKEMVRVVRVSDAIVRGWRPDGWTR